MANRKPHADALLTVDEVYRKPIGPASDLKSLYAAAAAVRGVASGAELVGDHAEDANPSSVPVHPVGGGARVVLWT